MEFARFMSSIYGRLLRIVAGIAIGVFGLAVVHGAGGVLLAIVGLVVLAAGLFDFCIFAPLFGGPFSAKAIPAKVRQVGPVRPRDIK